MKNNKRLLTFVLTAIILLGEILPTIPVFAWSNEDAQTISYASDFEAMTDEQLNVYIHSIATGKSKSASSIDQKKSVANAPLKAAWLAAAELAKRNGYECAGTLVQYSVNGKNYSETNGKFSKKIKTSKTYSNWKKNSSGAKAVIRDTFDFAYTSDMGSLFSTFVNDWGWLSQQTGALTPIKVTISISQ